MAVQIQMFGVEQVKNMLMELPTNMEKEVDKTEGDFMAFIQKSAKLRAPRFSGQLAESISKQQIKMGSWQVTVESPYGFFQEFGWSPKSLSRFTNSRSGYLVGDWMEAHGFDGFGITPKGLPHPFVAPAFEAGIIRLPAMLQNAVYKAAKESAK